jgi:hypothetical protein
MARIDVDKLAATVPIVSGKEVLACVAQQDPVEE